MRRRRRSAQRARHRSRQQAALIKWLAIGVDDASDPAVVRRKNGRRVNHRAITDRHTIHRTIGQYMRKPWVEPHNFPGQVVLARQNADTITDLHMRWQGADLYCAAGNTADAPPRMDRVKPADGVTDLIKEKMGHIGVLRLHCIPDLKESPLIND